MCVVIECATCGVAREQPVPGQVERCLHCGGVAWSVVEVYADDEPEPDVLPLRSVLCEMHLAQMEGGAE